MPRASSIKTHPRYADIVRAIEQGVPLVDIAARHSVSPSALSRFRSNRMDTLVAVIDEDTPAPDDLLARLKDLADSTRNARRIADAGSSPTVRARLAATELAVLNQLIDRAGITDMTAIDMSTAVGELVRAVQVYVLSNPDQAPTLFAEFGKTPSLVDLREQLKRQLKEQENNEH